MSRAPEIDAAIMELLENDEFRDLVAEKVAVMCLSDRGRNGNGTFLLDRLRRSATARAHRRMDEQITRALDDVLTPENLARALSPQKMADLVTGWLNAKVSRYDAEAGRMVEIPRFEYAVMSRLQEQGEAIADKIVAERAGPIMASVKATIKRRLDMGLNRAFAEGQRRLAEPGDDS